MAIRVAKALQDYIVDKIFVELQPNISEMQTAVLFYVQYSLRSLS